MRKPGKSVAPPRKGGAPVPRNRAKGDPTISFGRTGHIDFGVDLDRPPKARPTAPKLPSKATKKRTK